MFPPCQYDPTEGDHIHLANGVTNDSKGILSNLTIGGDVVRRVDVAIIDLASRNELIDFDRPRALNFDFGRSKKNYSRRFSIFCVFTQPRPEADIVGSPEPTLKYVTDPSLKA